MPQDITYQQNNSFGSEFSYELHRSNDLAKHFHRNFEILTVIEGYCDCSINNSSYHLLKNDSILICPFLLHEFSVGENSLVQRVNFNDNIVLTFDKLLSLRSPENPVFRSSPATLSLFKETLYEAYGTFTLPLPLITPTERRLRIKGLLYVICADCAEQIKFVSPQKIDNLAIDIVQYIANNYQNDISLATIAKEKGYSYQYLSRVFNRHLKTNFKKMLNLYRMQQAIAMLYDTELPITYVGLECGFQSIRSFNQISLQIFGKTPKEIRNAFRVL